MSESHERFDVGQQQVGRLYAKALLGASEAAGNTEEVLAELDSLVTDVLDRFPKLEAILASEMIPHDQRVGLIDRIFGKQASRMMLNYLKVLSHHGRLGGLRAIRNETHRLHDELRGRIKVVMTTAAPADPSLVAPALEMIRAQTGRAPQIESHVNPDLIGGVLLRMGDTVFDGSVASQLQQLRAKVMQQSIYQIQNRRNQFFSEN